MWDKVRNECIRRSAKAVRNECIRRSAKAVRRAKCLCITRFSAHLFKHSANSGIHNLY